jgi:hypothetical protein
LTMFDVNLIFFEVLSSFHVGLNRGHAAQFVMVKLTSGGDWPLFRGVKAAYIMCGADNY